MIVNGSSNILSETLYFPAKRHALQFERQGESIKYTLHVPYKEINLLIEGIDYHFTVFFLERSPVTLIQMQLYS